jgi:hypothetical protein
VSRAATDGTGSARIAAMMSTTCDRLGDVEEFDDDELFGL